MTEQEYYFQGELRERIIKRIEFIEEEEQYWEQKLLNEMKTLTEC